MNNNKPIVSRLQSLAGKYIKQISYMLCALVSVVGLYLVQLSPISVSGGAFWLNRGPHYLNSKQVSVRSENLISPFETKEADFVAANTYTCDKADSGFCQQSTRDYVNKTLLTNAVDFVPAVPEKRVITGYCTLCRDGTFSPSCAVGRGACSYHSGVSDYNVARYRITPGKPAVVARAAVYDYTPKTYRDSTIYTKPAAPTLSDITKARN